MKASLSEIFAVFKGITRAGLPLVQNGDGQHPVAIFATSSAGLQYDYLLELNKKNNSDEVAKKALTFLKGTVFFLEGHPDLVVKSLDGRTGGKVSDITAHIKDILEREKCDEARPVSVVRNFRLVDDFAANYLPQGEPSERKREYQEDDLKPSERAKRQGLRGGRPRKKAAAIIDPELV